MNAARRARQKANRTENHTHLTRAQRTGEDGKVARCLPCQPVRNDNEQNHVHGNQIIRRPVQGVLKWAAGARDKLTGHKKERVLSQGEENLRAVFGYQQAMADVSAEDVHAAPEPERSTSGRRDEHPENKPVRTAKRKTARTGSQRNG